MTGAMDDREAHEFYEDPEHLRPAGPAAYKRVRPGVQAIRYDPPEYGPQAATENAGLRPFWQQLDAS